MTNSTDYSDEYQHWDNTEPVTVVVERRADELGTATVGVSIARRGTPRRDAQFFNGVRLRGNEMTWLIPAALMDGVEIATDAKITDEQGVSWIVATAIELRLGNSRGHWECLCREARS
jgi:hypothetical protein